MKKHLLWLALPILIATLVYSQYAHKMDQEMMRDYYRILAPEAASFGVMTDRIAVALDQSGSPLAYLGVTSHVGYGGPILVGVTVYPDGSLAAPVVFSHKETQAYLTRIAQEGFFQQFTEYRADDALTPGFDVDAVSGASLSSQSVLLSVKEVAHTVAEQALRLTPKKADVPWQIGLNELLIAAIFALSLLAATFKKLAKYRIVLQLLSLGILGFWLNRSFSLAYILAACMGFFPSPAQNPGWYLILAGVLLPALILGKNLYCTFACPFCAVQELTHKISRLNLPIGPLLPAVRFLRYVCLFAALFLGFLALNPSSASYEPFGTIFGLNGANHSWYLLFIMLVASFFFYRFWCHAFCPAGAFLDFIAAKRRDLGKLRRGGKAGRAGGQAQIPAYSQVTAAAEKTAKAQARKLTGAQLLFVVFYIIGLISIGMTIWLNIKAG